MAKGRRSKPAPKREESGALPTDLELFLAEVADATPLSDRDRIPAPRPPRRARRNSVEAAPPRSLALERDGEAAWARGPGISLRQLADLRAGRLEPEAQIDLHGMRAQLAADRAEAFLEASLAAGRRCVLVITGRGRRTGGVSVVKEDVLERLSAGRTAGIIRALSTAQPRHGGTGALYVALKRP